MFANAEANVDTAPQAFTFGADCPWNACVVNDYFSSGVHVDGLDAGWTMVFRMDDQAIEGGEFLFPTMGVAFKLQHGDLWMFNPVVMHGTAGLKNAPLRKKGKASADPERVGHVVCMGWFLSGFYLKAHKGDLMYKL